MKFLVGDRVTNTMRSQDGVVTSINDGVMVYVDYGRGPEQSLAARLVLKRKGSDVQQALRNDPEALQQLVPYVIRMAVGGNPADADKTAAALSEVSSLSELEALDYYTPFTERSHGAKFDIFVRASVPQELSDRLGVLFHLDGKRAKEGELQINSRALALWLMQEHNMLPEKAAMLA